MSKDLGVASANKEEGGLFPQAVVPTQSAKAYAQTVPKVPSAHRSGPFKKNDHPQGA